MNENDTLITTRINLGGKASRANPYIRNTPEWYAWEAGYSAARRDTGRKLAERMR